jgi:lysyl-tRNA synthetase class 1
VCQSCGRIATTKAYGRDPQGRVLYRCQGGVAGKKGIAGCGHEGAAELTEGKLSWRLDWAARWKLLGVTCEPFGKDHAAAGGSWDTSSLIVEEIFGYPKPLPVVYEHILVGGEKMSKSKGNVVTLQQLLDVVPPEVVRWLFVRTDPNKHKDFDWAKLPQLVEEYERAERLYHGTEEPSPREDPADVKRAYELSQVTERPAPTLRQVPFSHLVTLVQIAPDTAGVLAVLGRTGELGEGLDRASQAALEGKVLRARAWVAQHAPEDARFTVQSALTDAARALLTDAQRHFLTSVSEALGRGPWDATAIHNTVHDTGTAMGLKAGDAFGAVYVAILGKRRGPRLGYFLASMDRAWVLGRLAEASDRNK